MSNLPFGFTPNDPDDQGKPQNPFDMGDLGSALSQLGAMLQGMSNTPDTGAVNWSTATDVARKAIATAGDPVVADAQRRAVEEAVRLADLWLDPATEFPSTGAAARAWSRSQWLEGTMPAWQEIITPIAEQVQVLDDLHDAQARGPRRRTARGAQGDAAGRHAHRPDGDDRTDDGHVQADGLEHVRDADGAGPGRAGRRGPRRWGRRACP